MAGFGGSVSLTGEKEYRNAIKSITNDLSNMSNALKMQAVEFDASDKGINKNSKSYKELNNSIAEQQKVISEAKSSLSQYQVALTSQQAKHSSLNSEYKKAVLEMERIKKASGENSNAYKTQASKVDALEQELVQSTNEMNKSKEAMNGLRKTINNSDKAIDDIKKSMSGLKKETKESGDGFSVWKMILANLGTQAINTTINGLKKLGATIINIGKEALLSYADYEQLVGGVETLYKDSANEILKYSTQAYKTAGLSANQYMETATSFSASLIQSLGGDTKKASEIANRAIIDMSDNANKMGTDMTMIQNAYQGFAKQNYTMLDNLKLGYGGTKTEMARLISDASKLTDIQNELNIEVKDGDMSFSNIANAISVVQKNLGIMGTTSLEAEKTIQGSTNAMKGAWQNLLTGIADDNADFSKLMNDLINSIMIFANNIGPRIETILDGVVNFIVIGLDKLLPRILNMATGFIEKLITNLSKNIGSLPKSIGNMVSTIIQMVGKTMPTVIKSSLSMMSEVLGELSKQLPTLLPELIDAIITTIVELLENVDLLIEAGVQLAIGLAKGLILGIPKIIQSIPRIITAFVKTFVNSLGLIRDLGKQIINYINDGISSAMGFIFSNAVEIGSNVVNGVKLAFSQMVDVGKNLVRGIWQGISGSLQWIKDKLKEWVGNVTKFIKKIFGIHSPSTLFRDEIGKNLALGIGEGFTDEMKAVSNQMEQAIPKSFNYETQAIPTATRTEQTNIVDSFKEALKDMKIILDGEVAGEFVEKTITRIMLT